MGITVSMHISVMCKEQLTHTVDQICDHLWENWPRSHLMNVEIPILKVLISATSICSF